MPLAVLLGIELLDAEPDLLRGRLSWTPETCTAGGLMHGGTLMALADTCGGVCAFLAAKSRRARRSSIRLGDVGPRNYGGPSHETVLVVVY
jgi:uncharacterized protein (TIGR00369 family)